jgi:hypothetical protein
VPPARPDNGSETRERRAWLQAGTVRGDVVGLRLEARHLVDTLAEQALGRVLEDRLHRLRELDEAAVGVGVPEPVERQFSQVIDHPAALAQLEVDHPLLAYRHAKTQDAAARGVRIGHQQPAFAAAPDNLAGCQAVPTVVSIGDEALQRPTVNDLGRGKRVIGAHQIVVGDTRLDAVRNFRVHGAVSAIAANELIVRVEQRNADIQRFDAGIDAAGDLARPPRGLPVDQQDTEGDNEQEQRGTPQHLAARPGQPREVGSQQDRCECQHGQGHRALPLQPPPCCNEGRGLGGRRLQKGVRSHGPVLAWHI